MATNKKLSAVITIGGAVSSSLKSAIGATTGQLGGMGKEIRALTRQQNELGKAMRDGFAGNSFRLGAMRSQYAQVTAEIEKQRSAYRRLAAAQERSEKLTAVGHKAIGVGVGMSVVGAGMMAPAVIGARQASSYATERARIDALGLGPETAKHAEAFARAMKTVGTSKLENLTLVRDALSVFGDLHHAEMAAPVLADMKFGNAAVFGAEKGHENEAKFMDMLKVIELRGGTKSQADFQRQANMVQKVISATGGRVGPEEWRHLIATGGLAAKGTRDDAFYYQLEPLVQEMGGDRVGTGLSAAYSSLFQGHITKRAANNLQRMGLIADQSKVKHDKAGQVSFMDPGALKGAELFRQSQYEWLKQVLMPALAAKGLTSKDQVLDAIGSIVSNKKGADILGAMYLQQQQIDKSERMNRGAHDIGQLKQDGMNTPEGRAIRLHQQMADLNLAFGEKVLPIYSKALTVAGNALERLNGFVERHPTLTKAMVVGLTAIGAALAVIGPLVVSIGGGIIAFAGAALMLEKVGGAGMLFQTVLRGLLAPLRLVGTAVLFIGRALLLNPIGLAITGIAAAAFLIYEYWGPIKGFFTELWGGVKTAFASVWNWIVAKVGWLLDAPGKIKAKVSEWFAPDTADGSAPPAGAHGLASLPGRAPRGGTTVHDNSQTHIHIVQQPGQDPKALADEVERRLRQRAGVRQRSSMVDPVGAQ